MSDINLRYLGILVQSFAIFVAISILLGRVYSLAYFDALEIPASEIRLALAEYSVASPEVTIYGIGFSAIVAVCFLFPWSSVLTASPWWLRIALGASLFLLGLSPWIYLINYSVSPSDLNTKFISLLMLLNAALTLFGVAIVNSGFLAMVPQAEAAKALRNAITPLIVALYLGSSLWLMTEWASTMGKVDAALTLAGAPSARIELSASSVNGRQGQGSDDYGASFPSHDFKVVMISDKFVYLRRSADSEPSKEHLYALPIEDVASILYISD
ncbi:MAG: hypothetical protein F4X64_05135 [Chloroflexi bacterium]|nr:hypothetical protein [Chloroflexota bacterium]